MQNGPKLWREILSSHSPKAIIAGGAVRDYLLGLGEPKDIDIFLPVGAGYALNGTWQFLGNSEPNPGYNEPGIAEVQNYLYKDHHKVQLVYVDKVPWKFVRYNFDIGVCMAYFQLDKGLVMYDEFVHDWENKTITMFRDTDQTLNRAKKLQQRFPYVTLLKHGY